MELNSIENIENIEIVTLLNNDIEEINHYDSISYFNYIEEIDENYLTDKITTKNKKCLNFKLCKKNIKSNNKYCTECFIQFNLKLKYIKNKNKHTCPICFMQEKNMIMVYIYNCKHTICSECLYSIYWDYSFIKNIPINPIKPLKKKWINFLKTKKGCYIQYKLINKLLYNYYRNNDSFDKEYDYLSNNINTNGINSIILDNLKELVHYQLKYKYYIYKNKNDKQIKELAIIHCPYCKSKKL